MKVNMPRIRPFLFQRIKARKIISLMLVKFLVTAIFPLSAVLGDEESIKVEFVDDNWISSSRDVVKGGVLTREALLNKIAIFKAYGFNENFACYAEDTSIKVSNDDQREFAMRRMPLSIFQANQSNDNGLSGLNLSNDVQTSDKNTTDDGVNKDDSSNDSSVDKDNNSYKRDSNGFYWVLVNKVFKPNSRFKAWVYKDSFIAKASGNMTKRAVNPNPPKISGFVFNDSNQNGIYEENEGAISKAKINLLKDNKLVSTTITSESGRYEFIIDATKGLLPGDYTLVQVLPRGWEQTTSPQKVIVEWGVSDKEYSGNDFGCFALGEISGYIYNDTNFNGIKDAGEKPIANRKIKVSKGGKIYELHTNEVGYYELKNLKYGDYKVTVELSNEKTAGTIVDTALDDNKVLDDENTQDDIQNSKERIVSISSGTEIKEVNFGLLALSEIEPVKVDDLNDNNVLDPGEILNSWIMHLGLDGIRDYYKPITTPNSWSGLLPGEYLVEADQVQPLQQIEQNTQTQIEQTAPNSTETPQTIEKAIETNNSSQTLNATAQETVQPETTSEKFTNGFKSAGKEIVENTISINNGTADTNTIESTTTSSSSVDEVSQDNAQDQNKALESEVKKITINQGQKKFVYFFKAASSEIQVFKFNDINANGMYDGDEMPLVGWQIMLRSEDGLVSTETATDSQGLAVFSGLPAGKYIVEEEQKSGWYLTTLSDNNIVLEVGERVDISLGSVNVGTVKGVVFHDYNLNGVKDGEESGVSGVAVTLNGRESVYTQADGIYTFSNILPGNYEITVELGEGWRITAGGGLGDGASVKHEVIVYPGVINEGAAFGAVKTSSISGFKFHDRNANGIWDLSGSLDNLRLEEPLPGWEIKLSGVLANGEQFKEISVVTQADGSFVFNELLPGVYSISETQQKGWKQTIKPPFYIAIGCGETISGKLLASVRVSSISGLVFEDENEDKQLDGLESTKMLSDWVVKLNGINFAGESVEVTTTTDNKGQFIFDNLLPGSYKISINHTNEWIITVSPQPEQIILHEGEDFEENNFGCFKLGKISGYIWDDSNADGKWQEDESGLEGFKISLVSSNGFKAETTTTPEGYYEFTGLHYGAYEISEVKQIGWQQTFPIDNLQKVNIQSGTYVRMVNFSNIKLGAISGFVFDDLNENAILDMSEFSKPLEGWILTLEGTAINGEKIIRTAMSDKNGLYSFGDVIRGNYSVDVICPDGWISTLKPGEISLLEGESSSSNNFGNFKLGKISGYSWNDSNADGKWQENEKGLKGSKIELMDSSGSIIQAETDENGFFQFNSLHHGLYLIDENNTSDWEQISPTEEYKLVNINSGTSISSVNFGKIKLSSISGVAFEDINGNALLDETEANLYGWSTIVLTGKNIKGEEVKFSTSSNFDDGKFLFEGLLPGNYRLTQEPMVSGVLQADDGSIIDAGWYNTTGLREIELDEGRLIDWQNVGNAWYGWIWGRVIDQKTGEPVAGVEVMLAETGAIEETDENGNYYFYKLEANNTTQYPGENYTVMINVSDGYQTNEQIHKLTYVASKKGSRQDFTLYKALTNQSTPPHTVSYWKNWKDNYTQEEMELIIDTVKALDKKYESVSAANLANKLTVTRQTTTEEKLQAFELASSLDFASKQLSVDDLLAIPVLKMADLQVLPELGDNGYEAKNILDKASEYIKQTFEKAVEVAYEAVEVVNDMTSRLLVAAKQFLSSLLR